MIVRNPGHNGRPRILLIGYGNPGRCDDGLGPALADRLTSQGLDSITIDACYQLQVEDAAAVSEHDMVLFADASVSASEPFDIHPITPRSGVAFSTHSLSPEAVMALAYSLFRASTRAYLLAIRGYEFDEFRESLSGRAQTNLAAAESFITSMLQTCGGDPFEIESHLTKRVA